VKLAAQFVGTLLLMGLVGHYLYVIVAVVAIWGLAYLGDRTGRAYLARGTYGRYPPARI
jgi:hypothetical protein